MTTEQGPCNPIPAKATYEPLEKPVVVIGPQFLAQYPVHLTISNSDAFSGDYFKVTDDNGTLIFQVTSKFFTIRDRRFLKDAAGNTLATCKEKLMSIHNRRVVFRGKNQEEEHLLFQAKASKMFQSENIDLNIYLANDTVEEAPDFKVKGKERSCTINLGNGESNIIIAKMQRTFGGNFAVTAYPYVDYAFVVAIGMLVFIDESADCSKECADVCADVALNLVGASN